MHDYEADVDPRDAARQVRPDAGCPVQGCDGPDDGGEACDVCPERGNPNKQHPVVTGVLDYFPDAIRAVAHCSLVGNEQHSPGQPLHWAKHKSTDEADALARHLMKRGTRDSDGVRHSAKVAWRALAMLQREIEAEEPYGTGCTHAELAASLWDGVFRLGDEGETRCGLAYRVVGLQEKDYNGDTVLALVDGIRESYRPDGSSLGGLRQSGWDLMSPTKRGPLPACPYADPDQEAARHARASHSGAEPC